MNSESKQFALAVVVGGVVAALALILAAGLCAIIWNTTELDELTGLDPSFSQWVGLSLIINIGMTWIATIWRTVAGDGA